MARKVWASGEFWLAGKDKIVSKDFDVRLFRYNSSLANEERIFDKDLNRKECMLIKQVEVRQRRIHYLLLCFTFYQSLQNND